jgi:hypothetical protein
MIWLARVGSKLTLYSTHFFAFHGGISLLPTMMELPVLAIEEPVDHGPSYRRCNAGDRQFIFYACRSSLVNGVLERGIFSKLARQLNLTPETVSRQWAGMLVKAAALLDNHPVEEHDMILAQSGHILFQVDHGIHRRCKWKHDREALRQAIKLVSLGG